MSPAHAEPLRSRPKSMTRGSLPHAISLHDSSENATDQSIAVAAMSADASEASNPPTLSSSVSVSAS